MSEMGDLEEEREEKREEKMRLSQFDPASNLQSACLLLASRRLLHFSLHM